MPQYLESMLKIALICGGPSLERGISLNSARSVMDHLAGPDIQIIPLYVDRSKNFYLLSPSQLYSNTPSDFDFKLHSTASKLDFQQLTELLQQADLAFPVIHGAYGEDGELQSLLEKIGIPFIGSDSTSCRAMFSKYNIAQTLKKHGFPTIPSILLSLDQNDKWNSIQDFFTEHALKRAIVKPDKSGSSIGVHSVTNPHQAYEQCVSIFNQKIDRQAVLEVFCDGREFTVLVLENHQKEPIALMPTEIEMNYSQNQIFDYRRKYLPTNQATYHTPPRFELQTIDLIRKQAEEIFKIFHMRDFVRMDGWILKDGTICFTDINPLSGLEQNSFLFRQTAVLGMTHRQTLHYLVKNACQRAAIAFPGSQNKKTPSQLPVYVLFGNNNAERQVSLMSGTNIWLKLLQSETVQPIPCLYDPKKEIWQLPYSYALNHTVEEVYENCLASQHIFTKTGAYIQMICQKLNIASPDIAFPRSQKLEDFIQNIKQQQAFVFIAMHGGDGENGTLQTILERYQIPFNGSDSKASAICMDKYLTGLVIDQLGDPDLKALPKVRIHFSANSNISYKHLWKELVQFLACTRVIIKPRSDGCSAGIVLLESAEDLSRYAEIIQEKAAFIPAGTFSTQKGRIEMPLSFQGEHIIEPYLETDRIIIEENTLLHFPKQGWIELTVGVLEEAGRYQALNPSIAVAEGAVLSLEEKFQGGTGINLTPPPEEILSAAATQKIKQQIEKAAQALGIKNYARLDIFYNRQTEKTILIEANTLPALTPSTVIYHQALAENPPLTPKAFIEKIIASSFKI